MGGFRPWNPASYLRPRGDSGAIDEILERLRVNAGVIVCSARDLEGIAGQPLRSTVTELWDMEPINAGYRHFIARFGPLHGLANGPDEWTPGEAFGGRTLLIHAFRRVLLHDPLFPSELLPANWLVESAYRLCRGIYRKVYSNSEKRVLEALQQNPSSAGDARDVFCERFNST